MSDGTSPESSGDVSMVDADDESVGMVASPLPKSFFVLDFHSRFILGPAICSRTLLSVFCNCIADFSLRSPAPQVGHIARLGAG